MQRFRQRLTHNTLALLLSNAGGAVLSFALSVLIGRVLGSAGLGVYAAALAWVLPLSIVAEFGLGTLLTREIAQAPEKAHAYLRVSILQRLWLGGLLAVGLWLLAPLLSDDPLVVQGVHMAAPLVVIQPFYSSFTAVFRAHQVMQPIAWLNLGMLLAQVTITAAIFALGGDVLLALAANTATSAGQLLAAWGAYRRRFYVPAKSQLELLPLLRAAYPFAIAAILAALQSRLNIILLERAADASEVGFYAAALRFVEAGRLLPFAFFDALFPLLSSLAETPQQLERVFRQTLAALFAFGVLFGVAFWWLGDWLILLAFGADFAPATEVLRVAAWILLPLLLKSGRILYWYARRREAYVNIVTVFVIVVQGILALWLIPRFGAVGAALASLLAETVAFLLLWVAGSGMKWAK